MVVKSNIFRQKFTILQADGLYPVSLAFCALQADFPLISHAYKDDKVEQDIFRPKSPEDYEVHYVQSDLIPPGAPAAKPWSTIEKKLRDQVNGIMVLKAYFTAEDLELFPHLRV